MRIIDLTPEHEGLFCVCLEDWSEEMKEAGDHKRRWLEVMKPRGLRVKLALDDEGRVGGMIQYLPAGQSFIEGEGLYFVPCIWVHGYTKGRGNFQKKGMGSALLKAAEEDVRSLGAKGLVVWGMPLPVFMRASWFRRHGYVKADSMSMQWLLWKKFSGDAAPPRWIKPARKPELEPGKVTVTAFINGWCPGMNMVYERARRAAEEFPGKTVFRSIETADPAVLRAWGICDKVFVDAKPIRMGPPPSYEKIRKRVAARVRKVH